jgi:hypothetical protein
MPNDPESVIVSLVILFPFFLGLDDWATDSIVYQSSNISVT